MFKNLFDKFARSRPAAAQSGEIDLKTAVAALLVEAARADDNYDEAEKILIAALLQRQFAIDEAEAERIREAGEAAQAAAVDLHKFSRVVKNQMDEPARIQFIEALWELILCDGARDEYEDYLARRLVGLIYLTDRQSGEARQRAAKRLAAARRD